MNDNTPVSIDQDGNYLNARGQVISRTATPVSIDKDGNYLDERGRPIGKSVFPDEYAAARRNAIAVMGEEGDMPIGPGLTTGLPKDSNTQGRMMSRREAKPEQPKAERPKPEKRPGFVPESRDYSAREAELRDILDTTGPDMDEIERIRREARQLLAQSELDMYDRDKNYRSELARIEDRSRGGRPMGGGDGWMREHGAQLMAQRKPEPVRGRGFSEATPIRPGLRPPGIGQDDYLRAREENPAAVDKAERGMLASTAGRRELDRLDAPARGQGGVTPEQAAARLDEYRQRYDRTMGRLSPEEADSIFGQLEAENLAHDRALAAASGRPTGDMGRMARR